MIDRRVWFVAASCIQLAALLLVATIPEEHVPSIACRGASEQQMKDAYTHEKYDKMVLQAYHTSDVVYRSHGCGSSFSWATAVHSVKARVNARLVAAVVIVESSCRPFVHSKRGAVGLMQIVPRIHHVSVRALQDPDTNIRIGTEYLSSLVYHYGIRRGLHHYFGMGYSDGNITGEEYVNHVLAVAGYSKRERITLIAMR